MRNGPWLHFRENWEKTGGGEDIDFFLRLRDIGPVVGVPEAAVTHPWWTNGRRSYWHFHMWGKGDGRLQKLYPENTYRSCFNVVETLLLVMIVLLVLWAIGLTSMSFPSVLYFYILIAMGIWEMDMVGNVLCDRFLLRAINSESLRGWRRWLGAMEASFIMAACELGRLQYHLTHPNGRLRDIGVRFDFFCGEIAGARRAWKVTYALKFLGFLLYGIWMQWYFFYLGPGKGETGNWAYWTICGFHTAFVLFIGSLFVVP